MTKIAKLPSGKILKFPDEIPDDIIDQTVKVHLADHIKKKQEDDHARNQKKAENDQKHGQIVQLLTNIQHLLHNLTQHSINEHNTIAKNHSEATQAFHSLIDTIKTPKKRRLIRDEKGKTIGAEEYD